MEVEHKHDTSSVIPHKFDGHVHPESVEDFSKNVDRQFGDIQKKALNWGMHMESQSYSLFN